MKSSINQKIEAIRLRPTPDFETRLRRRLDLVAAEEKQTKAFWRKPWQRAGTLAASLFVVFLTATVGVMANPELRHSIVDQWDPKGALEIRLAGEAASLERIHVSLDRQPIGEAPLSLQRLSEGRYIVKFTHLDMLDTYEEVSIVAGETTLVEVSSAWAKDYIDPEVSYSVELRPSPSRLDLTGSDAFTVRQQQVAFIRGHYDALAQGNLETAYRQWHQSVSFEVYKTWYADTQAMFIESIEHLTGDWFEVIVFEESSVDIVKYRVQMQVAGQGDDLRITQSRVSRLATLYKE